ncbi:DNA adenine methylase [Helicobacter sp. T3_23-1056]
MSNSLFDDCIDSSVKSCDKPRTKSHNKSTLIKSPLRYPGGKSRAIKFLSKFLPKDIDEFREPFFGGSSFSLYLAQNPRYKQTKIYANDINSELFCFWQSLQTRPNELINGILELKNRFQNGRDLYRFILSRRESPLDTLTRGIDFFILNRITFSGVVDSGGYSQKAFESRFTPSSVERLGTTQGILGNFCFSNSDYAGFLQGKPSDNKSVFVFLDPPYFSASKSKLYGKKGILHTAFNHNELCQNLKSTKHKFLLTYDNSAFIRELYGDFCLVEWDLQYGMNNVNSQNAPKGKELLISNFTLAKCTDDLAGQMQASQNRISKENLGLDFDKQIVV